MSIRKVALLGTALSGLIATPASAQSLDSGTPEAAVGQTRTANTVAPIVVTARKREEAAIDVPVIEQVVSAATLQNFQITQVDDLARVVPTLALAESNGALGTQVSMRGIGTSANNANIDASVALNVDGLQISQALAYDSALFDLQQVEVLKGPQSLFFGKNSPGGVIALRTADPTSEFEAIAETGYEFKSELVRTDLILSGPVTDTLGLRLAGRYENQEGYFNNVATVPGGQGGFVPDDRSSSSSEGYIVRGTLLWEPIPDLTARVKLNVAHDRTEGGDARQLVSCPDGVGPRPGIPFEFLGGAADCEIDRDLINIYPDPAAFPTLENGGVPFKETDQVFGTVELDFDLTPELNFVSTTGYYDLEFTSELPGSGSVYSGPAFVSSAEPLERTDFTQEFRLQSDFDYPLNFLTGFYYQGGHINNSVDLPANQLLGLPLRLARYQHLIDIEVFSAFGQARWDVTPELELAAGARWTNEKRDLTAYTRETGEKVLFPTATPEIESDNIAPEFTITYQPTDNLTLFGSYKVAYKSGSFDTTSLRGVLPDYAFGDEKASGFEVGLKGRTDDRQLNFSIAAYSYLYEGLQAGATVPNEDLIPVSRTLNAGSADVYGAEAEVTFAPAGIEGLNLQGSLAYTNARFDEFPNATCYGGQTVAAGCDRNLDPGTGRFTAQDLSGEPLVRAPDWQANLGITYEVPIGDYRLEFTNNTQYSSRYLTTLGTREDYYQDDYVRLDAGLNLRGPDDQWELGFLVKNLTNKYVKTGCLSSNVAGGAVFGGQTTGGTTSGPAGIDEVTCYTTPGRQFFLTLTARPFN